jgi:hypothetical protein
LLLLLLLALLSWPLYSPDADAASTAASLFFFLHITSSATLTNDKNQKKARKDHWPEDFIGLKTPGQHRRVSPG